MAALSGSLPLQSFHTRAHIGTSGLPTAVPAEVRSRTRGSWGILGGTFDPPHFGHLAIAEHVRVVLDLVGVLFVPAGVPPHKQGQPISPVADRVYGQGPEFVRAYPHARYAGSVFGAR